MAHLYFCDADYASKGTLIKCNPAIKTAQDRAALRQALNDGIMRKQIEILEHKSVKLFDFCQLFFARIGTVFDSRRRAVRNAAK